MALDKNGSIGNLINSYPIIVILDVLASRAPIRVNNYSEFLRPSMLGDDKYANFITFYILRAFSLSTTVYKEEFYISGTLLNLLFLKFY